MRLARSRNARVAFATAAIAGLLVTLSPIPASAAGCWTDGQPVDLGGLFYSVSVLGRSDAWAVGGVGADTVAEHWDGHSWAQQTSASGPGTGSWLTGVAALSTTNQWAVGDYADKAGYHSIIEHGTGTSWSIVTTPTFLNYNYLESVTASAAKAVWAVGQYSNGSQFLTLVERWNGTAWKRLNNPSPGTNSGFKDVTSTSSSDVWAVGFWNDSDAPSQTLIEHWNGTRWKIVPSPNAVGPHNFNTLEGVDALSTTDAWAVGEFNNANGKSQTLILHWNGTAWKRVQSPSPGGGLADHQLLGVVAVSPTNAYAVGAYSKNGQSHTLIERWNGTQWKVQSQLPDASQSLAGVSASSAHDVWAVGGLSHQVAFHCT